MIIADTGFWVAFFSRGDRYHSRARECIKQLREPLMTTLPVVTETCYLLQQRAGALYAFTFISCIQQGGCQLFQVHNAHLARIEDLMKQYIDLPMDFADASLVVLAEALGHGRILSTDQRDFHTYRWNNRHVFTNLLFESPI